MTPGRRSLATAASILAAAVAAGCGLGPGAAADGVATLTVTRDFGGERLLEATREDPPESETVARFLDREAEIETSYGGNFVDAIEGVEGSAGAGSRSDWFFFVNGYFSELGAGEARVRPGDRIWWDYHDWQDSYEIPAVVGSWPEPFAHGLEGRAYPVRVDCLGERADCDEVAAALAEEGVGASISFDRARIGSEILRLIVGPWEEARADSAAALLAEGPAASGVFASFLAAPGGGWELALLDSQGREARSLGAGAGLVAATRLPDQQASWLVTGTDQGGVEAAVDALDAESLRDAFALAVDPASGPLKLPLAASGRGEAGR